MRKTLGSFALVLLATGLVGFAGTDDPVKTLAEINRLGVELATKDRFQDPRNPEGRKAIDDSKAILTRKAKEAVAGARPEEVDTKNGLAWAYLYEMAEQRSDSKTATLRFLESGPSGSDKFQAQVLLLGIYYEENDGDRLSATLLDMAPATPLQSRAFPGYTNAYAPKIAELKGTDAAIKLIERSVAGINLKKGNLEQRSESASAIADAALREAEIFCKAGRQLDALRTINFALGRLGPNNRQAIGLKGRRKMMQRWPGSRRESYFNGG